jgi:hypothetical protein
LKFVARPGCTLSQYIEIWHGGQQLKSLINRGIVRGENRSFYSPTNDAANIKGAVFWGRIYKLRTGPGSHPGVDVANYTEDAEMKSAGTDAIVFKENGPETREDWDKLLEEYRRIIRGEAGNIAPLT